LILFGETEEEEEEEEEKKRICSRLAEMPSRREFTG
jgi:hypothetical protein